MSEFHPDVSCHQCGGHQWWDSDMYCKRHHSQAGYATTVTVDLDQLAAVIGRDAAVNLAARDTGGDLFLEPAPLVTNADEQAEAAGIIRAEGESNERLADRAAIVREWNAHKARGRI